MNRYILNGYRIDPRGRRPERKTRAIVEAATAKDAVIAAARASGAQRWASLTARFQRDPNPAVRDNAHLQVDAHGYWGWWAEREEAEARMRQLDKLAEDPKAFWAYLDSCP